MPRDHLEFIQCQALAWSDGYLFLADSANELFFYSGFLDSGEAALLQQCPRPLHPFQIVAATLGVLFGLQFFFTSFWRFKILFVYSQC